jgi:hypothetical protein
MTMMHEGLGTGMGGGALDVAALRDLFRGPGMDTRQWVSYGIVDADSPDAHSVRFNDDNGQALPEGVLVGVTLQPSGIAVTCRVSSLNAGSGEGEYSPYGAGDEVLVAIPEGNERAGCVIIGRLSNAHDIFPQAVAGQDVTNNDTTFRRMKTPYVLETGASYMVRSALTGASFSIDPTGAVILNDGEGAMLALNQSVISLQDKTGAVMLQMDPDALTTTLQADTTSLQLAAGASAFLSSGTLNIGTGGLPGAGHAITLEQVINLFVNYTYFLYTASSTLATDFAKPAGPLFPATFPTNFITMITAWLQGAVSPLPPTPVLGGGNLTAMTVSQLVTLALLSQLPDPAALGVPVSMPGIGRSSFTL